MKRSTLYFGLLSGGLVIAFMYAIGFFWEGLKTGLMISLIASFIYVCGWMFYSANYAPDYMEKYTQSLIEAKRASGATEEEMTQYEEKVARSIEMNKNPAFKAFITFTEIFPVGLVISLIGALVFRRKEDPSVLMDEIGNT